MGILKEFCNKNKTSSNPFKMPPMTVYEVGKRITDINNNTSASSDCVSPTLLKLALPYIIESLTYIYNLSMDQNKFPSLLKIAKVKPIPKSGDLNDLNNYRPISLLSILSKPLERHIHKHMYKYLIENNLLNSSQSGFRPGHSCHTALIKMCDKWYASINESNVVGAVFLDLKKAFDLVNHDILMQKLAIYFAESEILPFLQSYLSNRK